MHTYVFVCVFIDVYVKVQLFHLRCVRVGYLARSFTKKTKVKKVATFEQRLMFQNTPLRGAAAMPVFIRSWDGWSLCDRLQRAIAQQQKKLFPEACSLGRMQFLYHLTVLTIILELQLHGRVLEGFFLIRFLTNIIFFFFGVKFKTAKRGIPLRNQCQQLEQRDNLASVCSVMCLSWVVHLLQGVLRSFCELMGKAGYSLCSSEVGPCWLSFLRW